MANREDIRNRIRRINPKTLEVNDKIDKTLREFGYTGVIVDTTEDMSTEEEEMALFEGFLKEGYSIEEATAKAKDYLLKMYSLL